VEAIYNKQCWSTLRRLVASDILEVIRELEVGADRHLKENINPLH